VVSQIYRNAQAASVTGWNAGRIIDDTVFTNYKTMSASQIQTFLNKKVPVCDTWGTQPSEFGGGTRRQWAEAHGYKAPFTCLKDYSQGGKKASQIIYEAARDFKINPQVLLVLLQKEQGLVKDTWPLSTQYKSATGYGCPDTAPCDSQYYGLTNQVRWSARMFRAIMDNSPTWYTPYVLGNNYIRYNPDSSCGGSTVNIRNRATQALYNYTPYQPNRAALDAGWGTAPCGAYGNRNFHLYFNDWFGPMRTPDFSFESVAGTASMHPVNSTSLGDYSSTVTIDNRVYQFYYDDTNNNLRLLYWNGSKWTNEILDGNGATRPGTVTRDVGKHVKTANYKGQVQVFYYDATNGDLRRAWMDRGVWKFSTHDGYTNQDGRVNGNVGTDISATEYNGTLQLYYYDATNGNLQHSWWSDGSWKFAVHDGIESVAGKINGNVGQDVATTVYNGTLQLYYYDATNGNLQHSWWSDGSWKFAVHDGVTGSTMNNNANVGSRIAMAQIKGALYLFYYDTTSQAWKIAFWNGVDWYGANLDGGSNSMSGSSATVGGRLSAATLSNKSLQVFYKNNSGSLNRAWLVR
jgi:hypothetical protein